MLPPVLYHGSKRWTAPAEVAGLAAPPGAFLAPYQPSQRYMLLDLGGYTDPPLPSGRNPVAALMRLQRSRSPEEEESALEALGEWLGETGNEALVRAVGTWMRQVYVPGCPEDEALPRLGNPREGGAMLYAERVREWMAEREEKGRTEGRVEMMRRMTARKFGVGTAQRLAERLEGLHDPERMAQIGEWIIECESGADLLARLDQVNAFSPNRSCSTRIEGT